MMTNKNIIGVCRQPFWLHFVLAKRCISSGKHYGLTISGGIRVRIPEKLDVVTFWSWNLDAVVFQSWNLDDVAFCPLKKCLGITISWFNILHFSMPWRFSPRISMSWFFGLGISWSWFFGLGISMS